MSNIIWQDPPASRTRDKYKQFVAELRANPGRWGMWAGSVHHSTAQTLSRARPGIEAVVRTIDGERRLFARCVEGDSTVRYVPPGEEKPS